MVANDKLKIYHDLLLKWQKTINLVSPSTLNDAWDRHFQDSLQVIQFIPEGVESLCDIGSGAGFPGLVIAIERPELQVHLVESDARKCAFMRTVSRETNLSNVTIHNDRIENVMHDIDVDCVSARALASLGKLMDLTAPLWQKKPMKMIYPKGENYKVEIGEALQLYNFDVNVYDSITDNRAKILTVHNIGKK